MREVVKIGAYIAPFPLLLGILHLIFDLERPHLFWKLFLYVPAKFRHVHRGMASAALFVGQFPPFLPLASGAFRCFGSLERLSHRFAEMKIVKAITSLSFLNHWGRENLLQWRGRVALIGILLSICVGIYTGVLLGALVARPFWNNPILPLLFLLSAMKTGIASILLVGVCLDRF